MKTFYDKYKESGHSQNGEWGVINECLKRLGYVPSTGKNHYKAVEFGACDGLYCSNTADIPLTYRGWERILYDLNPTGIEVIQMAVTPENVNIVVPEDANVLSIDIDGNDYNVWKAYNGKPDIVIVEINSSINPKSFGPVSDPNTGTSYHAMVDLGIKKGYFLLCHTGNLIFIRNEHRDKFPEIVGDGILNYEEYFKTDWL
jgi:hypothetical protein